MRTRLIVALAAIGLVVIVACEEKHSPATVSAAAAHVASSTSPSPTATAVAHPGTPPRAASRQTHATVAVASSTPRHTTAAVVAPTTCGAPTNPWGYNFCGRGAYIYSPASDVCTYFKCIGNFDNGKGYMVECADGDYSMSGGRSGACSYHGGEQRPVFSGSGPH